MEGLRWLRSEGGKGQWGLRGQRSRSSRSPEDASSRSGGQGRSSGGSGGGGNNGGSGGPQMDSGVPSPGPRELLLPVALLGALMYLTGGPGGGARQERVRDVPMQVFLNKMLAVGEVDRIEVDKESESVYVTLQDGAIISDIGDRASRFTYRVSISSISSFERQLDAFQRELGLAEENFIGVRYQSPKGLNDELGDLIVTLALFALMGTLFMSVTRGNRKGAGDAAKGAQRMMGQNNPMSQGKMNVEAAKPSATRFSDVAGLGEAKVEVMEFVEYLRSPDRFETLGAKVPKGALLTGPPGTGKTLLAKAVSGEAQVPFFSVSGSDFVEMYVGVGPSRVRDLFKKARENTPSIVYIDEIDAIGKARQESGQGGGSQERESTLNQLLVEMDGFGADNGVVVLASTNRADTLDKALLRPGRFDRHISCDLPSLEERAEIFAVHLKPIVLEQAADVYIPKLAALTPGMSGAQIANICNEAALMGARRGGEAVGIEDFANAADRVIAGSEKKSRVMSATEKKIVAYHESGHVLTAWMLETMDPLLKTTIIPRTTGALGFAQYMPNDKHLHSQQELEDRLVVMLGGRAAEQAHFGSITTGASDDIKRVSDIAYAMLTQYGMSPKIGNLAWPDFPTPEIGYRSASNALTETVEREVNQIVRTAYDRASMMISDNKDKLELIAEELIRKETLDYDDVARLIGPRPFPHSHPYKFEDVQPQS